MAEPETNTLDARYGRTRPNRTRDRALLIGGAVAFAVVLIAWVVWAGFDGRKPTVEATDTGHRLMNDERAVEVSWTLSVPPGNETACIVQASPLRKPAPPPGTMPVLIRRERFYIADCTCARGF